MPIVFGFIISALFVKFAHFLGRRAFETQFRYVVDKPDLNKKTFGLAEENKKELFGEPEQKAMLFDADKSALIFPDIPEIVEAPVPLANKSLYDKGSDEEKEIKTKRKKMLFVEDVRQELDQEIEEAARRKREEL